MVGKIRSLFTDDQIREAIQVTSTYAAAAEYLGIPGKGSLVRYWGDNLVVDIYSEKPTLMERFWGTLSGAMPKHSLRPTPSFLEDSLEDRMRDSLIPSGSIAVDEAIGGYFHRAWDDSPLSDPIRELNGRLNDRILIISDMHIPYHHPDMLDFLRAVKVKYEPTRVICIGDEIDGHAMSFHTSDPDLDSAGTEISRARSVIKDLEKMFPVMDIVHSNHGSMLYRRGKEHGIPKHMLKNYNDVLGVGYDWKWYEDLTIELPNGQHVHFHHGRGSSVGMVSRKLGMSFVQGHYHSKFVIDYWGNPLALNWGMNVGCLIDDHSLAFAYNKIPAERPIIGLGMIIDSQPKLIPLVKLSDGRWNGKLN